MRRRRSANSPDAHDLVFDVLAQAGRPISAYEVLDRLRPAGISAPPTVYRALNRLIEEGRAHRLESLNAFVSCAHGDRDAPHPRRAAFAICDRCGRVEELSGDEAVAALHHWAAARPFRIRRAVIEMTGCCADCDDDAAPAAPMRP
jgi:Fur family zinc uptake transcriptional regulator